MMLADIYGNQDDEPSSPVGVVEPPALAQVPAELRALPQWVLWRSVVRGDGPTKIPVRADGSVAKANDPSTWTTFEAAMEAFREAPPGRFSGLGFVFADSDPYVGIDFDGCLDGGEIAAWARPWLAGLRGCYMEVSPSGGGVKVWARGELDGSGGKREIGDGDHTGIEVYDRGRYFTVTGEVLGLPAESIPERQDVVAGLYGWVKARKGAGAASTPIAAPAKPKAGPGVEWPAERRAVEYLAKVEPAVSGEGGHGRTLWAAMVGPAFDLAPDVAYQLLADHFNPRCRPPWDEKDLRRKVDEAYRLEARRGWLLKPERPGRGKDEAKVCAVEIIDEAIGLAEAVDNDYRLARAVLKDRFSHPDGPTLRFWKGEWHAWDRGEWRPTPDVEINAVISGVCRAEFERHARDDGKPVRGVGTKLVANVAAALRQLVMLAERDVPDQPTWLDGDGPEPTECMSFRNGVLHLPTLLERGPDGALTPPTPRFWTANALDYDFDPDAPPPVEWHRFLDSIWGEDQEQKDSLQQWFGYLLTADTSQHKALMIVGRPRSGKGTIARLLTGLVGEANTVAPTLTSLGTPFGLQRLIGKSIAFCGETRLTARSDGGAIVEVILSITGEDEQSVDRKYAAPWKGRIRVRFVFTANELPRLTDASKALMSRLVILELPISFVGREDRGLEAKLKAERPGILLWAIEGAGRLRESGRLLQPASSMRSVHEMEELSDPLGMFVAERCEAAEDLTDVDGRPARIAAGRLYDEFCEWSKANGRDPRDSAWFGIKLRSSCPFIRRVQGRSDGRQVWFYHHIRLQSGF